MSFSRIVRVARTCSLSPRTVASRAAMFPARSTRAFSTTLPNLADPKKSKSDMASHTAETYFKDVDSEAPADSKVHRVDSSSDAVQKPYEAPSGQWSQAGVMSEEYRTVDKQEPYDTKANGQQGKKLRYGGKETYAKETGSETSHPGEGPEGLSAGGRKPEGKQ